MLRSVKTYSSVGPDYETYPFYCFVTHDLYFERLRRSIPAEQTLGNERDSSCT